MKTRILFKWLRFKCRCRLLYFRWKIHTLEHKSRRQKYMWSLKMNRLMNALNELT